VSEDELRERLAAELRESTHYAGQADGIAKFLLPVVRSAIADEMVKAAEVIYGARGFGDLILRARAEAVRSGGDCAACGCAAPFHRTSCGAQP
jgi:hypothetical protein